jgi:hypothetical protein
MHMQRLAALLKDLTFTGQHMSCLEETKARHSNGVTLLRVSQFIPRELVQDVWLFARFRVGAVARGPQRKKSVREHLFGPLATHLNPHIVKERNADYDFT